MTPLDPSAAVAPSILAIDTAMAACSVAVWRQNRIVARRFQAMARGHAEALMPAVAAALAEAAIGYADLTHVAVTVGPGAFTGIRIGLSVARGIGIAAGIPVIGVTTMAVLAAAVAPARRGDRRIGVLIDSKRKDVFVQFFGDDLATISEPAVLTPDALVRSLPPIPLLLTGDGVALIRAMIRERIDGGGDVVVTGPTQPDAAVLARCAALLAVTGGGLPPIPLYLRAPAVTIGGGPAGIDG